MELALKEAKKAFNLNEVPVGAILVKDDKIITQSHNLKVTTFDATAHAELNVIQTASKLLKTTYLNGCTLYVTLEPCIMCAGALLLSRIDRIVFGAFDPKSGALGGMTDIIQLKKINHHPLITGGILEAECQNLLINFFKKKR